MRIKLLLLWLLAAIIFTASCSPTCKVGPAAEKRIFLFNGKDFNGWKLLAATDPKDKAKLTEVKVGTEDCPWFVQDSMINCLGKPGGYIRTKEKYSNYKLHVEWRWATTGGNSGVLLHIQEPDRKWPKSIEAQLMKTNAGDFFTIEGTDFREHEGPSRKVQKFEESSEKEIGQWNEYDIVCKNDTITVCVNGVLQNKATETTVTDGYIGLQSEGAPILFRNVYIEPLN
jgi:hypothetical protein